MIAEEYLRRGVRVYICARKTDELEAAQREMTELGDCAALNVDLSTMDGIKGLVSELEARENHLDILVNNAGAAWGQPFDEFSEHGWDKVMNINLKSVFFLTQKLAPLLRAAASVEQPAKVINIASIDGIRVTDNETYPYVTSKAGLIHLTRRLAKRLLSEHIYVTAIAPGMFASDLNVFARDDPDGEASRVPTGRIGRPDDMAGAAVYLASRAGDYVVGITLTVDGGVAYAS
jgi:2-deoxy-D-gluconate 3-dehydrogenase